MLRSFWFILATFLLFCTGCGRSDEEQINSAVAEARFLLNTFNCSGALEVLRDVPEDRTNADFVSVMASAIACEADYTATKAVLNLIDIDTNLTGFLSSFASFETSNETASDASTYTKILEAINYILESDGGAAPSTLNRVAHFGRRSANDLSMQALLMSTVALGKFMAFYGNTDAMGVKGNGVNSNNCLVNYITDAQMNSDLVADDAGSDIWTACSNGSNGHPDLDIGSVAPAVYKRRVCEAVVLFNNMFEIVANIDISDNEALGELEAVQGTIDNLYIASTALAASRTWGNAGTAVNTMRTITSQQGCEARTNNEIEIFYLSVFEAFLQ